MPWRTGLLILTAAAIALAVAIAGAWAFYLSSTDPTAANAALARLQIPPGWDLAQSGEDRDLLLGSSVTRYYLVPGDPESVTGQAREMLRHAGFPVEDTDGTPDCSSNHVPPHTSCFVGVALTDGLWRLEVVVYDRRGGALIRDAPWFAASDESLIVARITVSY